MSDFEKTDSANDDFLIRENVFDAVFSFLVSLGAASAFIAALLYAF